METHLLSYVFEDKEARFVKANAQRMAKYRKQSLNLFKRNYSYNHPTSLKSYPYAPTRTSQNPLFKKMPPILRNVPYSF